MHPANGWSLQLSDRTRRLLSQRSIPLQVKAWSSLEIQTSSVDCRVRLGGDDLSQDYLEISHQQASALSDLQASALNLPASVPYQLRVWSTGSWTDDTYTLNTEFLEQGQPVFIDSREGSIIQVGRLNYRLPADIRHYRTRR